MVSIPPKLHLSYEKVVGKDLNNLIDKEVPAEKWDIKLALVRIIPSLVFCILVLSSFDMLASHTALLISFSGTPQRSLVCEPSREPAVGNLP